jgi:hypothetical protein
VLGVDLTIVVALPGVVLARRLGELGLGNWAQSRLSTVGVTAGWTGPDLAHRQSS